MYKPEYIRSIRLPLIPRKLINQLPVDFSLFKRHSAAGPFSRSDSFSIDINNWCNQNISKDINFGFQIIEDNVPIHIDRRVKVKLFYLIRSGGKNVKTRFWTPDHQQCIAEYNIIESGWYFFQADAPHSVEGIEIGKTRLSLVGKIF